MRARKSILLKSVFLLLAVPSLIFSQTKPVVRIPLIGCPSYGPTSLMSVPPGGEKAVWISASAAANLAYYKSEWNPGVVAPRGWKCIGMSGTSGVVLVVFPPEIKTDDLLSLARKEIVGPAVQVRQSDKNRFSREWIAKVSARVFPKYTTFTKSLIKEMDLLPASEFPFGPFLMDKLVYKSDRVVEYQTPANSTGLGTMDRLKPDDHPIQGVAVLKGKPDTLLFLGVRLPADKAGLELEIIQQIERENEGKTMIPQETRSSLYEMAFKEYLALAGSAGEMKDAAKVLAITDKFERTHKDLRLANIYIWHRDLTTNNSILFSKQYLDTSLPVSKIHYADPTRINITSEPDGVVVEHSPRASKISYRLVFLK
jgi:hypothetical protein